MPRLGYQGDSLTDPVVLREDGVWQDTATG